MLIEEVMKVFVSEKLWFGGFNRDVLELSPSFYGLTADDGVSHKLHGILHTGQEQATTAQIVQMLEQMYCGPITAEFQHLPVSTWRDEITIWLIC